MGATLSCLVCKYGPPVEAAHVRYGLAGGMGLKPSDNRIVPLCTRCHSMQHTIGEMRFWALHHEIDPVMAARTIYSLWLRAGEPR